jgi:hypothetical protein
MRRFISLVLALGLALPLTLAAAKAKKLDILKDEGFKTEDYSKLELAWISSKEYLKTIKDKKNFEETREYIDGIELDVKGGLEHFCKAGFEGGKGGKTLKMTVNLIEYKHGSAAAAAFVGFGAGSGHIIYEIHLWDGKNDVAAFEARAGIPRLSGGWGDASGSRARAQIPAGLIKVIRKFFDTH